MEMEKAPVSDSGGRIYSGTGRNLVHELARTGPLPKLRLGRRFVCSNFGAGGAPLEAGH